jgi:hypothetical protein
MMAGGDGGVSGEPATGGLGGPDVGRPRDGSGGRRPEKDGRFGVGKEKMTWHGGTRELGIRTGKMLEQIVF